MSKKECRGDLLTYTSCEEFESRIRNEIPLLSNGTRNLHLCSQKTCQKNVFQKWAKSCKAIGKLVVCDGP